MPYLTDCRISTLPLEGGIQITDEQYQEAMSALAAGRRVCPRGGEMLVYSGEQRTVYRKATGRAVKIAQEDETPDDCTDDAPGEYQVWGAGGWEDDLDRMAEVVRAERDSRLPAAFGIRDRHRDQVDLGIDTEITPSEFQEVLEYIQALRDVPQQSGFPVNVVWPPTPTVVTAVT